MDEPFDSEIDSERSLYSVLSDSAPGMGTRGETALTATKETVDNDTEEPGEALLLLGD